MDGDYTLAEVAEIMRRPVDSVRLLARGKRLPDTLAPSTPLDSDRIPHNLRFVTYGS